MGKAKKMKQLQFMLPDRPGQLAVVTAALAEANVNITNICAYGMQGEATFMLTADSPARAKKALSSLAADIREYDVVAVDLPNKPGEMRKVAGKLGDAGISIVYMYGTTAVGRTGTCVFMTTDNARAIKLINGK